MCVGMLVYGCTYMGVHVRVHVRGWMHTAVQAGVCVDMGASLYACVCI